MALFHLFQPCLLLILAVSLFVLEVSGQGATVTQSVTSSTNCPTVTTTVYNPTCTKLPICATPACILLSTIANGCGCPSSVPTSTAYWSDCGCHGGCGVSYETLNASPCTTTAKASSTKSVVCPTVTTRTIPPGYACPAVCERQTFELPGHCAVTSTVPIPCGCTSLATVTSCPNCQPCTSYQGVPIPCPLTTLAAVTAS